MCKPLAPLQAHHQALQEVGDPYGAPPWGPASQHAQGGHLWLLLELRPFLEQGCDSNAAAGGADGLLPNAFLGVGAHVAPSSQAELHSLAHSADIEQAVRADWEGRACEQAVSGALWL